jgi:hypothetical protein
MENNFFTHDNAIKAITYLYPNLVHGLDYLVLMGLEEKLKWTPASDSWIDRWENENPQPTIDELKKVYYDNNLSVWNPVTNQAETQGTQTL